MPRWKSNCFRRPRRRPRASGPQPDFAVIHKELKGPNVTLQLLWEEYKQQHPDGYSYSRLSELYGEWSTRLDLVLRHDHRAGEKMFVDHAGQKVAVIDRLTGETREAYVFVAVTRSRRSQMWILRELFSFRSGRVLIRSYALKPALLPARALDESHSTGRCQ